MICRHFTEGEKLAVANLNEITVLIDRSEAELTEVGLNRWRPGLVGPPHYHEEKDQIFYVTSGKGMVVLGDDKYDVVPGHIVYIPAGLIHQTIAQGNEPLCYMLFNFFLSADKEGHASFAEHIEKVKNIRKQQAESAKDVGAAASKTSLKNIGKHIPDINKGKLYKFGSNTTRLLLDRTETARCEAAVVTWPPGSKGALVAHKEKEQTFFVLSGKGIVTLGEEEAPVKPGYIVFVPLNVPHTTEALDEELSYLCLNTYITETSDPSFDEMYRRIAPGRIERWKSGTSDVGE